MNAQPSLFERRPRPRVPYARASATSRDAATASAVFVGAQGALVLAWWRTRPDATQKECAASLGMSRASVAARVNALWQDGQLVKTDSRRDKCAVYEAR